MNQCKMLFKSVQNQRKMLFKSVQNAVQISVRRCLNRCRMLLHRKESARILCNALEDGRDILDKT